MPDNPYSNAMQQLLDKLDGGDPQIRQLLQQQLQDNQQRSPGSITKDEMLRRFRIQNKKLMEHVNVCKEQVKQVKIENGNMVTYLDYFLKLNKTLSAALGACENCWGEDDSCEVCGGNGAAGWKPLNKRLYNIYVRPAVEKANPQP